MKVVKYNFTKICVVTMEECFKYTVNSNTKFGFRFETSHENIFHLLAYTFAT